MSGPGDQKKQTDKTAEANLAKKKAEQLRAIEQKRREKKLDRMVDSAVRKMERQKPKDFSDIVRNAKSITRDGLIESIDIPDVRKRFGIPGSKDPLKLYGGFHVDTPYKRTIDLYRGDERKEKPGDFASKGKPIVFEALKRIDAHPQAVEKQIKNIRENDSPKNRPVDISLLLSVISHEGQAAIGSSSKTINSYKQGGLDTFHKDQKFLKDNGYLPADFPDRLGKAQTDANWAGRSYNEHGRNKAGIKSFFVLRSESGKTVDETVNELRGMRNRFGTLVSEKELGRWKTEANSKLDLWKRTYNDGGRDPMSLLPLEPQHEAFPAEIPQNRMMEAYNAVLNRRFDVFKGEAKKNGYKQADIDGLTPAARRVWTVTFFSLPGQGSKLLGQFAGGKERKDLNSILTDEKAHEMHSVMRGLVNAAEAELLDKHLAKNWKDIQLR